MDAGGEVAQVADRAAGLLGRGVQRRRGRVAARLLDPHQRLHEPLLRAVVEVAPDPPALLGRGARRAARARRRSPRRAPARRSRGRARPRTPAARRCRGRRRPRARPSSVSSGAEEYADRHHRPVAAHEPVLLDAHRAPARARPQQRALLGRERRAVGARVVDRGVAVAADQLLGAVVAEHGEPGGVDQAHLAARPDEIDRVSHARPAPRRAGRRSRRLTISVIQEERTTSQIARAGVSRGLRHACGSSVRKWIESPASSS